MNIQAIDNRLNAILARAQENGGYLPKNVTLAPGCEIRCSSNNSAEHGRSFNASCVLTSHFGQVIRRVSHGPQAKPEIPWDAAAVRAWEDAIIQDVFLGSLHVDVQATYCETFAAVRAARDIGADDCARKILNDLTLASNLSAYAEAFPRIKGALQFYLA